MDNKISMYKDLPDMINHFTIEIEGEITKKKYVGEFTAKIPTNKDQCLIGKHKAFLNGQFADQLDLATKNLHHWLAYLKYTLVGELPKFWKESDLGYDLIDMNVVKSIYDQVIALEEKWVREVWGVEEDKNEQESTKE